jgi:hypothetical protein
MTEVDPAPDQDSPAPQPLEPVLDEQPADRAVDDEAAAFGQQSLLPPATTGEPSVDAALAHLRDLDERPVSEHVAAFERVHTALADVLSDRPADA